MRAANDPLIDPGREFVVMEPYKETFSEQEEFMCLIEDPDEEVNWFTHYFVPNEHATYIASHEKLGGAVAISIVKELVIGVGPQYRVIVWRSDSAIEKMCIAADPERPHSFNDLCKEIDATLYKYANYFHLVRDPKIIPELMKLEDAGPAKRKKLGVLFVRDGQMDENEHFGNEHGSAEFEEFLSILGERVRLKGFTGYSAQLDTKNDQAGLFSVRRDFLDYDIMFHVSTLLPFFENDEQQVQRKRHIGNDICVIVFVDGKSGYPAESLTTKYTNVFGVVRPAGPGLYELGFARKKGVPDFGPHFCRIYPRDANFLEVLLTKMLNGERAACVSPEFRSRQFRTQRMYLDMMYDKFYPEAKKDSKMLKMLHDSGMARRAHQSHPQVFEAELVTSTDGNISAIVDNEGVLFIGSERGVHTHLADEQRSPLIAQHADVRSLRVIHDLDMLIGVAAAPAQVFHYSISQLLSVEINECFEVSGTKKADFIDVGVVGGEHTLVVQASYYLHAFSWTGTEWELVHKTALSAKPTTVSFCGEVVIAGVKNEFLEVDVITGDTRVLHTGERSDRPVAALPMGGKLLLCYERYGVALTPDGRIDKNIGRELTWTGIPVHFDVYGPCLIVVSAYFLTVRSVVNGCIIETHPLHAADYYESVAEAVLVPVPDPEGGSCLYRLKPAPRRQVVEVHPFHVDGDETVHDENGKEATGHPDDDWLERIVAQFPTVKRELPEIQAMREASLARRRRHSIVVTSLHSGDLMFSNSETNMGVVLEDSIASMGSVASVEEDDGTLLTSPSSGTLRSWHSGLLNKGVIRDDATAADLDEAIQDRSMHNHKWQLVHALNVVAGGSASSPNIGDLDTSTPIGAMSGGTHDGVAGASGE